MSQQKQTLSCLIITYGPVPTPQYQTIEGGGMRAWGLAKGLLANNIDVTVGVNNSFSQELSEHDGVKLVNWNLDEQFISLMNSFDSVIISYCMGDPSIFVANNISKEVQLILDLYVPIYVEVSARESKNVEQEYKNYFSDLSRHNNTLSRGDYFLCASESQKIFYTGVLSSLGIINPRTYRESRLLIVPFGIHSNKIKSKLDPYKELGLRKKDDKRILWFGGMYPWFRVDEFIKAISILSKEDASYKFVIVGGKNPFNPNPDFSRQYDAVYDFAKDSKLLNKNVFFVDWVDFDTRINWYEYADFVISINQPGEENILSWRTRVMDYVWGEVVTLTNGGDTLSEDLLKSGAALKMDDLSSESIVKSINDIYKEKGVLSGVKKSLTDIKPKYYWENVTEPLSKIITEKLRPSVNEKEFRKEIGFNNNNYSQIDPSKNTVYFGKARKAVKLIPKALVYAKNKGLRESSKLALNTLKNQTAKKVRPNHKQYIFLSHPIDNSGAPVVLLQVIHDLISKNPSIRKSIRVIAPLVNKNRKKELLDMGIVAEKAAHGLGGSLTGAQLSIKKNDFVLLNTVAIFDNYRNYIFNLLGANRLNHAYWFIHEDVEQTKVVAPQLLAPENIKKIHKLVESEKLTIFVPSKRVQVDYNRLLQTEKVKQVNLRVDVEEKYLTKRPPGNYQKINFLLSGNAADGRKGQLVALAAFQKFLLSYQSISPDKYRDFSVSFVAVNNDYLSQQIKSVGKAVLGDKLLIYPSLPRDKAMEITYNCNAVICCSLNETFALYVAEGMAMGHIVLRNNSAGVDEQLIDGVNGYSIDSDNINQFAEIIEKILNKSTLDKQLCEMGSESQKIAAGFLNQNYSNEIKLY
ncbi:glycosyltransferase [Candidatus Saccharibacteria bacterium]|nr:glycosyltransferase [Candidatus Saccharibacteria bacterium]